MRQGLEYKYFISINAVEIKITVAGILHRIGDAGIALTRCGGK